MDNKLLIELLVPELEQKFDVFIPVTKRVGNIISLLAKAINEMGINYNELVDIILKTADLK